MLKLDFTIVTSVDRNKYVSDFFEQNPHYKPSDNELKTITDYILYGKDEDGESVVDRHEVEIETKYGSYAKRKAESLDALMETPGFNENSIVRTYVYKKPKPHIDKIKDASVPGMRDLWKSIEVVAHRLEDPNSADSANNPTSAYKLKHALIDLYKQQYVLKEAYGGTEHTFNPNVHKQPTPHTTDPIDWSVYQFYPLGLKGQPNDTRFAAPRNTVGLTVWDRQQDRIGPHTIDFTNPLHIYTLAKHY